MIRTTARRGAALLLLLAPALARSTPCAECGMEVDPASRFSARIVRDGKELPFCDVGDNRSLSFKRPPHASSFTKNTTST